MFADDTNLFFEHTDLRTLFSAPNEERNKTYEWFNENKLSLHADRKKYSPFHKLNKTDDLPRLPLKGATKLHFMHYSRVVIILFSAGLCKSAFCTYSFGKTRFSSFYVLVFHDSISLVFNF